MAARSLVRALASAPRRLQLPAAARAGLCSSSSSSSSTRHAKPIAISSRRPAAASTAGPSEPDDSEGGDDEAPAEGKPLRVERLLANLGYGRRRECAALIKRRKLTHARTGQPARVGDKALASELLLEGEPLDPAPPLTLLLHKPTGYVVTSPDDENVADPKVYDLLPWRFGRRRPFLSAVGRLDKETSGLLLLTDDGKLLHSIQSPARAVWKRYTARLAQPLAGRDAAAAVRQFAGGRMLLQGDRLPLLPAGLRMLDERTAEVAICEGRYHQVRRMFAALGREVVALHRHAIGGLDLEAQALPAGVWRLAAAADVAAVLAGPDLQQQVADLAGEPGAGASSSGSSSSGSSSSSSSTGLQAATAGSNQGQPLEGAEGGSEQAAATRRARQAGRFQRRRAALAKGVRQLRWQDEQEPS